MRNYTTQKAMERHLKSTIKKDKYDKSIYTTKMSFKTEVKIKTCSDKAERIKFFKQKIIMNCNDLQHMWV